MKQLEIKSLLCDWCGEIIPDDMKDPNRSPYNAKIQYVGFGAAEKYCSDECWSYCAPLAKVDPSGCFGRE